MSPADKVLNISPVVPVLVIDDARSAVPLAEALVAGGIRVLEVTLRTPAALDAIRAMSRVNGAVVGAGTVVTSDDLKRSIDAGASFLISPGLTDLLADAAASVAAQVPLIPGVSSASDLMRDLEHGFSRFKFFPAEAAGGTRMLKSLASPFPQVRFCPTGGISPKNAREYLVLDNVSCVGGSWLAPPAMIQSEDWKAITDLARAALALRP